MWSLTWSQGCQLMLEWSHEQWCCVSRPSDHHQVEEELRGWSWCRSDPLTQVWLLVTPPPPPWVSRHWPGLEWEYSSELTVELCLHMIWSHLELVCGSSESNLFLQSPAPHLQSTTLISVFNNLNTSTCLHRIRNNSLMHLPAKFIIFLWSNALCTSLVNFLTMRPETWLGDPSVTWDISKVFSKSIPPWSLSPQAPDPAVLCSVTSTTEDMFPSVQDKVWGHTVEIIVSM